MLFRSLEPKRTTKYAGVVTAEDQRRDDCIQRIMSNRRAIDRARNEETGLPDPSMARDSLQRYRIVKGVLYRVEYASDEDPDCHGRLLVVVPKHKEKDIMRFVHEAYGHPRGTRFIATLLQCYWFPQHIRKAQDFVKRCHACQLTASAKIANAGKGRHESAGVGMHVYIDHGHVGETDESPEKSFLVMVDQASGFISAAPVRN